MDGERDEEDMSWLLGMSPEFILHALNGCVGLPRDFGWYFPALKPIEKRLLKGKRLKDLGSDEGYLHVMDTGDGYCVIEDED